MISDLDRDANPNEDDEPGLVGWRVLLNQDVEEGDKGVTRETRTEHNGTYKFDDLPLGNYTVSVPCDRQPKLWIATWPNSSGSYGTSITEDSPDSGYINFLLVTLDEPPVRNGSIVGKVVWDQNRDGIADPAEPPVVGWQIDGGDIYQGCFQQSYQVTYTAADGSFRFDNLAAGKYTLSTPGPSGLPHPDYLPDSPGTTTQSADGFPSFLFSPTVDVSEGGVGNITIGLLNMDGSSSMSGDIYVDENANGVRDSSEPLVDCDCWMGLMYRIGAGYSPVVSRITTAAAHGTYAFEGLVHGDYWVGLLQSPGAPIAPPPGSDGYAFRLVSVGEGGTSANVDFGIAPSPGSSLPTVAPTPGPTAPVVNGLPPLGAGTENSRSSTLAVAIALAAAGAMGLAIGARWWARRCG